MPGVVIALFGLVVFAGLFATAVLVTEYAGHVPASHVDAGTAQFAISAAPTTTPALALAHSWSLAAAGLVGPSAWLTAPRETEDFAVRRTAIIAAYAAAEDNCAAALAAAGWDKWEDFRL